MFLETTNIGKENKLRHGTIADNTKKTRKYRKLIGFSTLLIAILIGSNSSALLASGLQSSSVTIASSGQIAASNNQLGAWFVPQNVNQFPSDAKWVVAAHPTQDPGYAFPSNVKVVLDNLWAHIPWDSSNPMEGAFQTAAELTQTETNCKAVNPSKFWGIIFIGEEHNRYHIQFNDDVNVLWFGERMLGYPLYKAQVPSATIDQWKDEMFLRMTRGFYNYYHALGVKVGQTIAYPSILQRSYVDYSAYYYGTPALNFIRQNYDFVVVYAYTTNLHKNGDTYSYFLQNGEPDISTFFQKIAELFPNQQKIWILTRIWSLPGNPADNTANWEMAAVALEVKHALDQNMIITYQYDGDPSFNTMWPVLQKAVQLYNSGAPYYESYTYGKNLLTGTVGNTYGWVGPL
jgi:hypothetical protein